MLACLDLEGVLLPEIWIAFAEKTGIEELRLTTRDVPDYDQLMVGRLKILKENKLKLIDIESVIKTLTPLEGAKSFLDWLKSEFQVIILSDTFYQFARPLMGTLDYPTLFCHELIIDNKGEIKGYRLRQPDGKTKAVSALKGLNFKTYSSKLICVEIPDYVSPSIDLIKKQKIYKFLNKKKYKLVWSGIFSNIFKYKN